MGGKRGAMASTCEAPPPLPRHALFDFTGYGTYLFSFSSPGELLDPQVTLGLFLWDGK